ncbi:hypothetical protein TNCV_3724561 [Trichonephila clavipes]|nr:hypothetical protein TNCV_3724561 [Trichonephila clavipes]
MKCVHEWFARFREGYSSVSDNPRSGRPVISVSDENIEKMRPDVSGTTLKRNGKAWNGVLLHHLIGKRSEQKYHASKQCSSPFMTVKTLSSGNSYLNERREMLPGTLKF